MIKDSNSIIKWVERISHELMQYDDISTVLDRILLEARRLSNADAGTVYLTENDELVFAYTHNDSLFHVDYAYKYSYADSRLPINPKSIAGYCATTRKQLNLKNVHNLPPELPFTFNDSFDKITGYTTISVLCVPLIGRNDALVGVIQLINSMRSGSIVPFTQLAESKLDMLGVQAVNAVERSVMAKEMIHRMQMMAALSDPQETGPHVERVGAVAAELFQVIAEKKNIDIDKRRVLKSQIRLAAMSHDLGKVAIPQTILKKPAKLTEEEFIIMRTHCMAGAQLFPNASVALDIMARDIALNHHQKWDGTGYTGNEHVPLKKGEEISLEARIVAVADVFDALCSSRCYKEAWSWEDAIATLKQDAGTHFDPQVVEAFLEIEDVIKIIYTRYQEHQEDNN